MSKKTGCLFVVATPIGNLKDITLRALDILKSVDCIAAEDTRHTQKLLQHYGIHQRLMALHEYNETQKTAQLLLAIQAGQQIALVTDAGTPLISDPGFRLVKALQEAGVKVIPIPGACAAIAALSVSGLPTDHFVFEGFLPSKRSQALEKLKTLITETRTLIFYEAPHRIENTLALLVENFGPEREACLARELTKVFETVRRDNLSSLQQWIRTDQEQRQGEFVVLVHGASLKKMDSSEVELKRLLTILLADLPLKQAVNLAVKITQQKRNTIYQMALALQTSFPHTA
jgi:16S rRNA (cytidine1402-2'-O)-methyltransferase